ncbi:MULTISPECIES: hypothetical protein [unclassified Novosphingobium]|nr:MULTISPECIES: hypothetical protein [unclassified Novosphingobium]WRT95098.1 hypothetical protein U9J33_23150 [Novosphingobium sp. RL4]
MDLRFSGATLARIHAAMITGGEYCALQHEANRLMIQASRDVA